MISGALEYLAALDGVEQGEPAAGMWTALNSSGNQKFRMSVSRSSTRVAMSARSGVEGTSRSAIVARFSESMSAART